MKDDMKPWMSEKLDHIILHIGTNDLNSDRALDLITKSIIDLEMKSNSQNTSISTIIMRNDEFNNKAEEVNGHLKYSFLLKRTFSW